jgi:DNA-binding response OmpR family regulator
MGQRLLLVDDEENFGAVCAAYLADLGYAVDVSSETGEARQRLECGGYDAVLLDLVLPEDNGLALLSYIRARWPALPVVMVTAYEGDPRLEQARGLGVEGILLKPLDIGQLRALLQNQLSS